MKKQPGDGAVWEKNQEPKPEPQPEPEKNLPAPQPCLLVLVANVHLVSNMFSTILNPFFFKTWVETMQHMAKIKNRIRSRLKKKSGAGAAKKFAGSSFLREDKKHKENVL